MERLSLKGKVQPDGTIELVARGIVHSPRLATGNVPVGTEYDYPIRGRLETTMEPVLGREDAPAA
jgi:hypothetical protein